MSYATVEDVQFYHPGADFGAGSSITSQNVQSWLELDTAFIDSALFKLVDLTKLTTAGREVLRMINAKLTAGKVDEARPGFNLSLRNEKERPRDLRASAMKDLRLIKQKKLPITPKWKPGVAAAFIGEKPPPVFFTKETIF